MTTVHFVLPHLHWNCFSKWMPVGQTEPLKWLTVLLMYIWEYEDLIWRLTSKPLTFKHILSLQNIIIVYCPQAWFRSVIMTMMLCAFYVWVCCHCNSLYLVSVSLRLTTSNTHTHAQSLIVVVYLLSRQVFSNSDEAPINKKLPKELLLR